MLRISVTLHQPTGVIIGLIRASQDQSTSAVDAATECKVVKKVQHRDDEMLCDVCKHVSLKIIETSILEVKVRVSKREKNRICSTDKYKSRPPECDCQQSVTISCSSCVMKQPICQYNTHARTHKTHTLPSRK